MALLLLLYKLEIESAGKNEMHVSQRNAADHRFRVHRDYAELRMIMRQREIEEAEMDEKSRV